MFNKIQKSSKIAIWVFLLILVVIAIVLMFNFFKKSSRFEIVETRVFSCSNMPDLTFKYPVFKGWEIINSNSAGRSECTVLLSNASLKANNINTEIAPQIKISRSDAGKIGNEKRFVETNKNGLRYGKIETGYEFLVGTDVIKVELFGVVNGYGFSKDDFFKEIIESFKITTSPQN